MTDSLRLRRALVQNLESLHRSGVRSLPSPPTLPKPTAPAVEAVEPSPPATLPSQPAAAPAVPDLPAPVDFGEPALPESDREPALAELAAQVAACERCAELAQKRTQTVFGVGNPLARLVFFGEAPGADEDRQGEPFVGKAGQLLTKIIEACQLRREDVYIMNVLKCRPPGNRNPTGEEATCCRPFFERQLQIIRPDFICCLGSIAATTLLDTTQSVGRLRGKFHTWNGIQVMATYHPAYLLRNPSAKKLVWADMKMLMKSMGVEL